jgi:hypothetical protein
MKWEGRMKWEYAHCVNEVRYLSECGAEGWRVVPGTLHRIDGGESVWLLERPLIGPVEPVG